MQTVRRERPARRPVPGGPNDASAAEMNQKEARAEPGVDSAAQRGHGAHGKGWAVAKTWVRRLSVHS